MNCKQGDLAVVVSAIETPEMIGSVVEVVCIAYPGVMINGFPFTPNNDGVEVWKCKSISSSGIPCRYSDGILFLVNERPIRDSLLRPIRDQEGEDETLTWAGKPEKVSQ